MKAATTDIWLRVSVPVLSVQMNVVDPKRLDGLEMANQGVLVGHPLRTQGKRQRDGRSRPSGTSATATPTAKKTPSLAGIPNSNETAKKAAPTEIAMSATKPHDLVELHLQRSGSARDRRRQRGDARRAGCPHPSWRQPPHPSPRRRSMPAGISSPRSGCAGTLSPVSGRLVHGELGPEHQLEIGADPVAGLEQDQVSDDQLFGRNADPSPVASDEDRSRKQALQALTGLVGAMLLDEREAAVEKDHHDDGERELRHPADPRHRQPPPRAVSAKKCVI